MTKYKLLSASLLTTLSLSLSSGANAQNNPGVQTQIKNQPAQASSQPGAGQADASASARQAAATQNVSQTGNANSQDTQPVAADFKPEPGLYAKPCNCQAQNPSERLTGPQGKPKILKGLAKEMGTSFGDLGKDLILAFSVQGNDPYEMPANPDIPYIAAQAQLIDGSSADVWKYPDKSLRVSGGFLDGTYACPQADGLFIVQYTNGARGTLKVTGNGCEVLRPDNTLTTVTKSGSSGYRVSNNKLGYMGDLNRTTGLDYEFAKQGF